MHDMQANDKATTANNWKTPGTLVSGCYNSPPLQEDLVPRSRMAPGKTEEEGEEVKLTCFFEKMSESKEPCKVKQIERKNAMKMNKVEKTPLETRKKEHY